MLHKNTEIVQILPAEKSEKELIENIFPPFFQFLFIEHLPTPSVKYSLITKN